MGTVLGSIVSIVITGLAGRRMKINDDEDVLGEVKDVWIGNRNPKPVRYHIRGLAGIANLVTQFVKQRPVGKLVDLLEFENSFGLYGHVGNDEFAGDRL